MSQTQVARFYGDSVEGKYMSLRGFVLLYVNTLNIFRLIKLLSFSPNMNNYLIDNIFTFIVYGFSALSSRFLHFILQHTTCFLLTAKTPGCLQGYFLEEYFHLEIGCGCYRVLRMLQSTEPFTCSLFINVTTHRCYNPHRTIYM